MEKFGQAMPVSAVPLFSANKYMRVSLTFKKHMKWYIS